MDRPVKEQRSVAGLFISDRLELCGCRLRYAISLARFSFSADETKATDATTKNIAYLEDNDRAGAGNIARLFEA